MYSAGCYPAELELFQKRTLLARPSPFVCLYFFIHLFIYYLSNLYLFTYSLICLKKVTFLGGEEGGTHKSSMIFVEHALIQTPTHRPNSRVQRAQFFTWTLASQKTRGMA